MVLPQSARRNPRFDLEPTTAALFPTSKKAPNRPLRHQQPHAFMEVVDEKFRNKFDSPDLQSHGNITRREPGDGHRRPGCQDSPGEAFQQTSYMRLSILTTTLHARALWQSAALGSRNKPHTFFVNPRPSLSNF